jgi:hypothetical protein
LRYIKNNANVIIFHCRLDYTGIALLIVGSYIPCLYYGFYCYQKTKIVYITIVCLLGLCCIGISLWENFNTPKYRVLRAGTIFSCVYVHSQCGVTGDLMGGNKLIVNRFIPTNIIHLMSASEGNSSFVFPRVSIRGKTKLTISRGNKN